MSLTTNKRLPQKSRTRTTASVERELATLKRRIKRAVVEAGINGWLTPPQAKFWINVLGLRHE